jgi:tetratricopeptide (TPR) repeat protein
MISSKAGKLTLILVCTGIALAGISLYSSSGTKVTGEKSPFSGTAFAKTVPTNSPFTKEAEKHFIRARKFLDNRQLDKALKEFQETVKLSPKAAVAHYWVGMVFFFKRDFQKAIENFETVLKLEPRNYHAMAMIGKILSFNKNKVDEAAGYLRRALEINPEFAEAHSDMAHIYAMRGDLSRAISEFRVIFQSEPKYAKYHYELGRLFESMKALDRAKREFNRALVLDPRMKPAKDALERIK